MNKRQRKIKLLTFCERSLWNAWWIEQSEAVRRVDLCGITDDMDQFLILMDSVIPDVVLIGRTALEEAPRELSFLLNTKFPKIPYLVYLPSVDNGDFAFFMKQGARGVITDGLTTDDLVGAICNVGNGGSYFRNTAARFLDDVFGQLEASPLISGQNKLTPREMEVIRFLAEGLSFKEIAARLLISPRTVETHKNNILGKLDFKTTAELVKFAIRNHLTSLS